MNTKETEESNDCLDPRGN